MNPASQAIGAWLANAAATTPEGGAAAQQTQVGHATAVAAISSSSEQENVQPDVVFVSDGSAAAPTMGGGLATSNRATVNGVNAAKTQTPPDSSVRAGASPTTSIIGVPDPQQTAQSRSQLDSSVMDNAQGSLQSAPAAFHHRITAAGPRCPDRASRRGRRPLPR